MDSVDAAARSAKVAAVFNQVADTYDSVGVPWFTPIAERLVTEVAPAPGERVLDLGTGRGAALWPLAQAVGPTGRVTGLDLAARMIEATRADAETRRLVTVELVVGDASSPDLPPSGFDVAVASLVLFFLPDPGAALQAWHDLLRPGGRLGVATFGSRDPAWEHLDDVFTPFLPPHLLDARTSGKRGPFASDTGVTGLLTSAGFTSVRTTHLDLAVRFTDIEQWHRWSLSHGQRTHWEAVPEQHRATVLNDAAQRLQAIVEIDGGFTLTQQIRYTIGSRPSTLE